MPQVELTDRFCRSAKAQSGAKTDYFDTVVKGLCLRVSGAGAKTWHLVYSKRDRSRAWLKLGRYPDLRLGGDGGARQKARDERAKIGDGVDPVGDKRSEAAALTVRDLVENYIERSVRERDPKTGAFKLRSHLQVARRLRRNVSGYGPDGKALPDPSSGCIGDIKLADLHRRDITRAIDAVMDRGAPTEARHLFIDLGAMIKWARGRGDIDQNLMEAMPAPSEPNPPRERFLTADEIRIVWNALPGAVMSEATRRILRLCLITGQRLGEVAGMTRSELDLARAVWTIPAARAKNARDHVVPLSGMALTIIAEQLADNPDAIIFPGPKPHFKNAGRAPAAMSSAAIGTTLKRTQVIGDDGPRILGVAPWTAHDLRRTAATFMAELGVSPFLIGHVLNHVSTTKATITTKAYAHYTFEAEKREALDKWAARLNAIIGGGADVVPLRAVTQ
jgi:integrase